MSTPTITFRVTRPSPASGTGGATLIRNIGPFRNEDAALSFLVGRLKTALRPVALFLFGSRAAGSARPDSDFDLLVILPDAESGPPDYHAAYAPVAGCGVGVDVVPCRLADFEAERRRPGTIAHAADSEGRLLYASPGSPFRDRWRAQAVGQ
ncbi:MAG: nucleotidyltransferase domain-containing protein [Alphaproteobacteria bacterium]|nr:nucleotidyltransferase domain-containing protein [Alphaproteobacteria bacterium]